MQCKNVILTIKINDTYKLKTHEIIKCDVNKDQETLSFAGLDYKVST